MNVAERLFTSAARLPDKPAVIFNGQVTTYGALSQRVAAAAAAFARTGLRQGDRVALLLANSPSFIEAIYGAWRAGLVPVPINVTFTPNEVSAILADSGARAVVVATPYAGVLQGVREALPALDHVIVAGSSAPPGGAMTWKQFLGGDGGVEPPEIGAEDLALLQYTSGTTGRPKGAMLTHGNLLANQSQMERTQLRVQENDVILCVLPLFHIYALNVGMGHTFARGATLLLEERFDPLHALEEIDRHRASILIGAPPMYVAWLNTPGVEDYDLASVRFAVSGAAALPAAVLERFGRDFGICIWEGYGLTETSPALTTVAMGTEVRPGSVGKPLPGVEVRILDERRLPVPEGDPGEVFVRGPNVFKGYWNNPEATREVLDEEGWFATGDVGYVADGDLYLVDRKKDLIIVSGFNVYPREVEDALYRHPKVAGAAVVGTPHPYTGEAVKAYVVVEAGEEASADELIDFCRRSLARFKTPEVIEFVPELPYLPTGKVKRRELREKAG